MTELASVPASIANDDLRESGNPCEKGVTQPKDSKMKRDIASTFRYQVGGIFVGMALSIASARALGPSGKGEFGLLMSSISVLTLLLSIGLPSSIVYMVPKGFMTVRAAIKLAFVIASVASIVTVLFVITAVEWNVGETVFGSDSTFLFAVVPLGAGIGIASGAVSAILAAQKRFVARNRLAFLGSLTTCLATVIWLVAYGHQSLSASSLCIIMLVITLFSTALAYSLIEKELGDAGELNKARIADAARFGGKSVGADLLQTISYRLDYWIVGYYCGLVQLGVYTLAVGLSQYIWLLPNAVSSVLFPNVAGGAQAEIEKAAVLAKVCTYAAAIGCLIGCPILFWAIPIAYGESFAAAPSVLAVLCVGVVPFCFSKVHAAVLAGSGRVELNLYAAGIGMVVTVVLDCLLIPEYGILGAAGASSLAYISTTAVVLFFVSQVTDKRFRELMILRPSNLRI